MKVKQLKEDKEADILKLKEFENVTTTGIVSKLRKKVVDLRGACVPHAPFRVPI